MPSGSLSVPVLPLRDVVVYPHMIVPLYVGRERSIKALELVMATDKQVMMALQKDTTDEKLSETNLYEAGTMGTVLQLLKLVLLVLLVLSVLSDI